MTERFDALIQMLTHQIQGDTSEKVSTMNKLGREQFDLLDAQERMLEGLLQVVKHQKERLSAWAPKPEPAMPRIVQQGPRKEQANG